MSKEDMLLDLIRNKRLSELAILHLLKLLPIDIIQQIVTMDPTKYVE